MTLYNITRILLDCHNRMPGICIPGFARFHAYQGKIKRAALAFYVPLENRIFLTDHAEKCLTPDTIELLIRHEYAHHVDVCLHGSSRHDARWSSIAKCLGIIHPTAKIRLTPQESMFIRAYAGIEG